MLVQRTIDAAQRNGIAIYSIYSYPTLTDKPDALARLAFETGGKAFVTGMDPRPSLQAFLQEIQRNLAHQYLLTFAAERGAKSRFAALRITTNTKSVELNYPARVYVAGAK
jgi:hypothetical protein